jgi:proline iminopeptidase
MTVGELPRRSLYPPIEPYRAGTVRVSDLHEIYFEESGNPSGKPVVFIHGGPGGCTEPKQRRFFDPAAYRIVLFDQRGSGKSTPHACLTDNTTWHLVADMERIREHLGIARWQLFGGSWGSTLALAYAETHPHRVTELVLRGVFLLREREIDWFYQRGADAIFPDAWEEFIAPIPADERGDLLRAYHARLTSDDRAERTTLRGGIVNRSGRGGSAPGWGSSPSQRRGVARGGRWWWRCLPRRGGAGPTRSRSATLPSTRIARRGERSNEEERRQ